MVNNMDIIIHGKPLDASERFTAGIDRALATNIIKDFFGNVSLKDDEALVVDARYWNGAWVSVYTLRLGQNVVKDMSENSGRPSYFAISLVIPQSYCISISQVYYLLEKVVKENVIGVYLNKNLRYICPNFEDSIAFERLCTNLKSSYKNLEVAFDRLFQPQAILSNDSYCNIEDCDSLAFVQLLKNKGRVIVTEKAETKAALVAQSSKYRLEAQQAQRESQERAQRIIELENSLAQMANEAKEANSKSSGKVKKLEEQVVFLKKENEQLNQEKQNSQNILQKLRENVTQAMSFLDVSGVHHKKQETISNSQGTKKSKMTDYVGYLLLINTLLILVVIMGLLINYKGCSDVDKTVEGTEAVKEEVEKLNEQLTQKEEMIDSLKKENKILLQYKTEMENSVRLLQESTKRSITPNNATKAKTQSKPEQKEASKVESKSEEKNDSKKESESKNG